MYSLQAFVDAIHEAEFWEWMRAVAPPPPPSSPPLPFLPAPLLPTLPPYTTMGRRDRNARTCAQKKTIPPPPPPETVELPELPFDVIPLVLHAIFFGWDDQDPEATCRAAVRWSTLRVSVVAASGLSSHW